MLSRIVFALALIGLVVSMVSLNATKSAGMTKPKANVKGAGYSCNTDICNLPTQCTTSVTNPNNVYKVYWIHQKGCGYSYNPFASCSENITQPCWEMYLQDACDNSINKPVLIQTATTAACQ